MSMVLIILLNLVVGVCIGLTGIAGFLLPMFYTGFLGMPATEALALSFAAFLISGVLGSVTYHRTGNLELRSAGILSAGSFVGALVGVRINLLIPEDTIKLILYVVVLLSGVSILLRKNKEGAATAPEARGAGRITLYLILGLVTGAVCAASGAGGPVLVMPLLTLIGFPAHMAVGISLFDSIFIALPAAAGYLYNVSGNKQIWIMLPALLLVHGIGVVFGGRYAVKINQVLLKRIVASASILIACIKLFF